MMRVGCRQLSAYSHHAEHTIMQCTAVLQCIGTARCLSSEERRVHIYCNMHVRRCRWQKAIRDTWMFPVSLLSHFANTQLAADRACMAEE